MTLEASPRISGTWRSPSAVNVNRLGSFARARKKPAESFGIASCLGRFTFGAGWASASASSALASSPSSP